MVSQKSASEMFSFRELNTSIGPDKMIGLAIIIANPNHTAIQNIAIRTFLKFLFIYVVIIVVR